MKQKVWVLDDPWEKGWTLALAPNPAGVVSAAPPDIEQGSPVAAFSLSLVVWGGGHFYLGKSRPGSIYLATMVLFYAALTAMAVFPGATGRWLLLERPILLVAALIGLLVGLLVWGGNAVDAYYRAVSLRTAPFLGLDRCLWPVSASLLLPGWGQFLNGQPKKGILFLLGTLCGAYSALLLIAAGRFWSVIGMSPCRKFIEISLIAAAASVPLVLILWIASAYDAFQSCRDFIRHKQRAQMAGHRLPGRGLLHDLSAQCSAVLGLMLASSLGMQFIPKEFYLLILKRLQAEMLQSHLTFISELIRKATEFLSG
jgi:TM2 domain-containing membrane protein YozV